MEPEVICVMNDECVEGRVGEEDCAIDKETFDSPVGLARWIIGWLCRHVCEEFVNEGKEKSLVAKAMQVGYQLKCDKK